MVCIRGSSNQKGIKCKKQWLKDRFIEGLKLKKLVINGRFWGIIELFRQKKQVERGWFLRNPKRKT